MKILLAIASLALAAGCAAPSYPGGPTTDDPYAILTPFDRVSLWRIDNKPAWNRTTDTYLAPGAHHLKMRIEYTVDYEGEGNFEWKEIDLTAEEGVQYIVGAKPDGMSGERELDLPPYKLVVESHPIRGYRR